jgi:hypothetical protein
VFSVKAPFSFTVEKKILRSFLVQLAAGAVVDVEFDPEVREGLPHHRVVLVHDGLRRGAFLHRAQGDGGAVLIAAADDRALPLPRAFRLRT